MSKEVGEEERGARGLEGVDRRRGNATSVDDSVPHHDRRRLRSGLLFKVFWKVGRSQEPGKLILFRHSDHVLFWKKEIGR